MSKLLNIVEGWSKTLKIMKISKEERELSDARLKVCAGCPMAKESSMLKNINAVFHNVGVIKCNECGCPINEKSQVMKEECPLGKWADIDKAFSNKQ